MISERSRGLIVLVVVTLAIDPPHGHAAEADGDFVHLVAPLLRERCLSCHSPTKKRGGLDLTSRKSLILGGESGPAIVPGRAGQSLLIAQVTGDKPRMPRQGPPLTKKQVADLRHWIDAGAPWPANLDLNSPAEAAKVDPKGWALRPIVRPPLPSVADVGPMRTPIDAFVRHTLIKRGLTPSPPADRTTWLRRVTFNLHGLPPTPAEIDAFLGDSAPDAFEKQVDRLLASERYGERWGRHWLDVVHYADTHGYDKDKRRPNAWPYRDYVIRAFNEDKPYGQFVREQLAGDVFFPDDPRAAIATGFIAAGPWDFVGHVELREGTIDKMKTRVLDRDDMVATTISTFCSLTAHCARCHDHKFDPIPQRDYYRLQAVFAGVDRGDRPLGDRRQVEVHARLAQELTAAKAAQKAAQSAAGADAKRLAAEVARLEKEIAEQGAKAFVYAARPLPPRPVHLLNRGEVDQPKALMSPGALSAIPTLEADFHLADRLDEGARRAALAKWITDPANVLTWRSIVNRVWHYHFGRGIVDTPNDFGANGSLPTHPELLDWLAADFLAHGQSLKRLHRQIVLSATYRQTSSHHAANALVDADNRFLWRMNRQRLDAESLRDAVLFVSGKLDLTMGGPGYALFRFKDDHSPVYDHTDGERINDPATYRRTVYRFVVRSVPNPFLECLDCADPNIATPVRNTTLTALQALALLNDPFMVKQAEFFAERLTAGKRSISEQVDLAYRLAFGRPPTGEESKLVCDYATRHGLVNTCRLLFNANEFVFVD